MTEITHLIAGEQGAALTRAAEAFVSRVEYTERLHRWFVQGANGSYLLLTGSPGSGKSLLLADFCRQLRGRDTEDQSLLRFRAITLMADERGMDGLISDLAKEIGVSGRSARADIEVSFSELLDHARRSTPRLLVILDQLDALHGNAELLQLLPASLPCGVRVVLALRESLPALEVLTAHIPVFSRMEISALTDDELVAFAASALEPLEMNLLRDGGHLQPLDEVSGRNALVMRKLLRRWTELSEERKRGPLLDRYELDNLLTEVDGFFARLMRELGLSNANAETDNSLEMRLLLLMSVARMRLAPDQLQALLAATGCLVASERIWKAIHRISPLLTTTDRKYFGTFCLPLERFLSNRRLGPEGERDVHKEFVQWLDPGRPIDVVYRMAHLPYHLFQWGWLAYKTGLLDEARIAFTRLYDLLTDTRFVRDKITRTGSASVLEDVDAALTQVPVSVRPDTTSLQVWAKLVADERFCEMLISSE